MLLWPYRLHITTWIIKVSITLIKIINKNNEREREREWHSVNLQKNQYMYNVYPIFKLFTWNRQ